MDIFSKGGTQPQIQTAIGFIDGHRGAYGGEPIHKVLTIASFTYFVHGTTYLDPARPSARAQRDPALTTRDRAGIHREIRGLWHSQRLAATRPRGHFRHPLHGRAADRQDGFSKSDLRKTRVDHDQRQGNVLPSGSRQSQFHAPAPSMLWRSDFTYIAASAKIRLRRVRHRRLCPKNRRGENLLDGSPCKVSSPMPWNRHFISVNRNGAEYLSSTAIAACMADSSSRRNMFCHIILCHY